VYTLAISGLPTGAGTVDVWINHVAVSPDPVTVAVNGGGGTPPVAPTAIWGLYYPTAPGATTPHPLMPTGPELVAMDLQGVFELTANPRPSFVVSPENNEADWFSTGTTASIFLATARFFALVRSDIGVITDITNDRNQMTQFPSFVKYDGVVMHGVTYNGYVTRDPLSIFDGLTPYRVFVP
jgi:hypothetical protein